ncbi:MAG: DUF1573 domain-containing protein [Alistipes sp.]
MRTILLMMCALLCLSAQARKPKGAHLQMEVTACDFGDVPRKGGDLVKEFVFTNDGTTPLVITRIITSCSCIKADFSKRPLTPGASSSIKITYEPHKREAGTFNKVIQVYSNTVEKRHLITLKGNSIESKQ